MRQTPRVRKCILIQNEPQPLRLNFTDYVPDRSLLPSSVHPPIAQNRAMPVCTTHTDGFPKFDHHGVAYSCAPISGKRTICRDEAFARRFITRRAVRPNAQTQFIDDRVGERNTNQARLYPPKRNRLARCSKGHGELRQLRHFYPPFNEQFTALFCVERTA